MKKKIYCGSGHTLKEVAWKFCVVFIPGIIQNLTGHSPRQPAIGHPALSRGVGLDDLQGCLPTSTIP